MNRAIPLLFALSLAGCLQQARDEHDERADRIHEKLQRARADVRYCQGHPDRCADGDLERYQDAVERYEYALERNDRELARTEENQRAGAAAMSQAFQRTGDAFRQVGTPSQPQPTVVVLACQTDGDCPGLSVCMGATYTRKGLCSKPQ